MIDTQRDVEVAVITGLSGAGRSEAADALEDLGWFVIDNLPPALIDKMLALALAPGNPMRKIALVIDARGGKFFEEAAREIDKLRLLARCRVIFLEAADDVLVRRFDSTRRRHPLARDSQVSVGIQRERQLMNVLREGADLVVDTSDLSVHQLRSKMRSHFEGATFANEMTITLVSFGFKHGLPLDADMVLDVRFLPNPHWVEALRPLTGLDPDVRAYVMAQQGTKDFIDRTKKLLDVLLPGYQNEGRHYLTMAVGCTGGRHRSVVLTEEIARLIGDGGLTVSTVHRDVERPSAAP
ncbi:MAG: RNase adapter RapZ [Actinomycetota bacterium]|nr:RNase adapter RapZ [Actinomycetota bacterium]